MNQRKSIQFKAAFLLIAFSLNTVVGFACAVGLDMGFNSHHHEENEIEASGNHRHDKSHHPGEVVVHHHRAGNDKDNCCNGGVMKFQKLDKALSSSINTINPVFSNAFVTAFLNIGILSSSTEISGTKYFVLSHHPPIPDIRIAIQSFQI